MPAVITVDERFTLIWTQNLHMVLYERKGIKAYALLMIVEK